jgi:subtilase family serine protease
VISQSFGSAEEAFASTQSLLNLRDAYTAAATAGVTVLASSGDGGTANILKTPVKTPTVIPFPTVIWPASDPLVTAVGGTNLCTNPLNTTTRVGDWIDPPSVCQNPANAGQVEVGWAGSGGGFSHVFAKPSYQNVLPAGSTSIDGMRGVPDVALQASPRTGALVFISLPPDGLRGLRCVQSNGTIAPCSTGWYDIGGTSLSCPQWAAMVAIGVQINGGNGLGMINPALYKIASNVTKYSADFFDVKKGKNQTDPTIPGYSASTGWDPITGLGTPNAAKLIPDLVWAVNHP